MKDSKSKRRETMWKEKEIVCELVRMIQIGYRTALVSDEELLSHIADCKYTGDAHQLVDKARNQIKNWIEAL